jgi:hypothetical protein
MSQLGRIVKEDNFAILAQSVNQHCLQSKAERLAWKDVLSACEAFSYIGLADPFQIACVTIEEGWHTSRATLVPGDYQGPLPNLIYTDGNEFSLWRSGELAESIVRLDGDIVTSGANLDAPPGLLRIIDTFLRWEPIPPRDAKQLAEMSARLCRLLRSVAV